jgi:hypothetical protein
MKMQDLQKNPDLTAAEAKLGSRQRDILDSLRDHKQWPDYQLTGWVYDSQGGTRKAMQALVKRGLARVEQEAIGPFKNVDVYYPL